jgi:hypothetical protein
MSNYVTIGFRNEKAGDAFFKAVGQIQNLGGTGYPSAVFCCDTIGLLHRDNVNGVARVPQTVVDRVTRNAIVKVLCSQALSDHLGDVRDAEVELWKLIGVEPKDIEDSFDSAWMNTRATLKNHDIPLPNYLQEEGDD